MTYQLMTVKVSDIMEYPTNLGNRCMLLEYLGLDACQDSEIAVLWVEPPPGEDSSLFDFFPAMLDVKCDTGGVETELFPGLSYTVHCTSKQRGLLKRQTVTEVESVVCISSHHSNTRIWLLKGSADFLYRPELPQLSALDTVFRCGCWRTRHTSRHIESFEI